MKKFILLIISLFFLQISCLAQTEKQPAPTPKRIVSLSPSITEILYELGLGDKVVGVTDYCNFPEDAKDKFRIGGYLDTNYEAMIFVRPDLVIGAAEFSDDVKKLFESTDIEHMTVNTETTGDIFEAIKKIGQRNGVEDKAKEIVARMCRDIVRLRKKLQKGQQKRVMIIVGKEEGSFENLYIAGKTTFYNELLLRSTHDDSSFSNSSEVALRSMLL